MFKLEDLKISIITSVLITSLVGYMNTKDFLVDIIAFDKDLDTLHERFLLARQKYALESLAAYPSFQEVQTNRLFYNDILQAYEEYKNKRKYTATMLEKDIRAALMDLQKDATRFAVQINQKKDLDENDVERYKQQLASTKRMLDAYHYFSDKNISNEKSFFTEYSQLEKQLKLFQAKTSSEWDMDDDWSATPIKPTISPNIQRANTLLANVKKSFENLQKSLSTAQDQDKAQLIQKTSGLISAIKDTLNNLKTGLAESESLEIDKINNDVNAYIDRLDALAKSIASQVKEPFNISKIEVQIDPLEKEVNASFGLLTNIKNRIDYLKQLNKIFADQNPQIPSEGLLDSVIGTQSKLDALFKNFSGSVKVTRNHLKKSDLTQVGLKNELMALSSKIKQFDANLIASKDAFVDKSTIAMRELSNLVDSINAGTIKQDSVKLSALNDAKEFSEVYQGFVTMLNAYLGQATTHVTKINEIIAAIDKKPITESLELVERYFKEFEELDKMFNGLMRIFSVLKTQFKDMLSDSYIDVEKTAAQIGFKVLQLENLKTQVQAELAKDAQNKNLKALFLRLSSFIADKKQEFESYRSLSRSSKPLQPLLEYMLPDIIQRVNRKISAGAE